MSGFRDAVLASGTGLGGWSGLNFGIGGAIGGGITGQSGSLPSPFDAPDRGRLIGPAGSHPLAAIALEELVAPASGGLDGQITFKEPVRIGEALSGHLVVTARHDISARSAMVRLVGGLITEQQRSREERDSQGKVIRSESWVEINGNLFDQLPFTEPALPTTLTAGQKFEADFTLPAPRLGPVTAHMGCAVLAWALDAKWDIPMRGDEHVAALVKVAQNIDYLRSGAVTLEQGALFDAWQVGDASIAIKPIPPVAAGSEIEVTVNWPSAGSGRGGRLELQADVKAPNGISGIVLFSMPVDPAAFRTGTTLKVPVPADAPATLNDKGVVVGYRIRALVDRPFRSDLAVERALAVM